MNLLAALSVDIDLPRRFRRIAPPLVTQIVVATICLVAAFVVRWVLDAISPGAAPFALIFPAVMMATLVAGLRSGLLVASISLLYAWYFVMPVRGSFQFADPAGPSILLVVTLATAITLAAAHIFAEAVRRAQRDRDRQIADRDLLLREFDHRVKNNFAIVISLLELQRRRADPSTAEALTAAQLRVEGIARAHAHLYHDNAQQPGTVEIATYLNELCAALDAALNLADGVHVACTSAAVDVPRDRAVSIGLIVNELVTNAAKHAFVGRDQGTISVAFDVVPGGWRVTVADDGVGLPSAAAKADRRIGLGTRLIDAFARQANGTVSVESGAGGTRVMLDLPS